MDNQLKKLTAEIKAKFLEALGKKEVQEAIAETKAAKDTGTFEVVISTADRDRQGDIIMQDGWVLDNYLKNPVVLFGHDYWSLPIGICDSISVVDGKLVAKGRFAGHDFAQNVRQLYDAGMLKATSVGFIPLETEGNVILRAELLEFSFVPVPANPMALSLAHEKQINLEFAFAKGILVKEDTQPEPVEPTEPTEPVATEPEAPVEETPTEPETPATEEPASEAANTEETTPPAAAENNGDEQQPTGGDTTNEPSPQPEATQPEGSGEGVGGTEETPTEQKAVEDEPADSTDVTQLLEKMGQMITALADLHTQAVAATVDKALGEIAQKAGRTLSKQTRALLETTLAKIKESGAAIQDLLDKADADSGDGKAAGEAANTATDDLPQGFAEVKSALQRHIETREVLRMVATAVGNALEKQNSKIKELRQK